MGNALKIIEGIVGPLTIGSLVRAYRVRNDLTQDEVAAKLKVKKNYVSDIENNRKPMTLRRAIAIADALGESKQRFMEVYIECEIREAGENLRCKLVAPNAPILPGRPLKATKKKTTRRVATKRS